MTAMKNQLFTLAGIAIACTVISACTQSEVSTPPLNTGTPSAGTADFTNFVSIGDSLTAGYADGTLYLLGQQNSFPALLAQQFAEVGGGTFRQPLVADPTDAAAVPGGNLGGLVLGGNPILDPVTGDNMFDTRFVLNTETEMPERLAGPSTIEVTDIQTGAFNNTGVPGAKSFHLLAPGYGNLAGLAGGTANPFFVRFASSSTTTVVADAAAQAPSFYTLWIGSNDVIWYGFGGGTGATSCAPAACGQYDITDPAAFATVFGGLVATMKAANASVQGVLVNVPDVTTIPYFTTVPYNPVPLDQATADLLNAAYTAYNDGLDAALASGLVPGLTQGEVDSRKISFSAGQNAVVLIDEDLTDLTLLNPALVNMRQATADDLIPLEVAAIIGELADPLDPNSAWGVGKPLEDQHVLIASEIQAMQNAVASYNATIEAAADADVNLVLFDVNALFAELVTNGGVSYGTGSVNDDFATGGFFSLDGIHPTARGSAIVANSIVDVINSGFNANVFKVNPADYPTVFLK